MMDTREDELTSKSVRELRIWTGRNAYMLTSLILPGKTKGRMQPMQTSRSSRGCGGKGEAKSNDDEDGGGTRSR